MNIEEGEPEPNKRIRKSKKIYEPIPLVDNSVWLLIYKFLSQMINETTTNIITEVLSVISNKKKEEKVTQFEGYLIESSH